jgi:aspartate racemase
VYRRLLGAEFGRRRPGRGDAPVVVDELDVPTLFGFIEKRDLRGLARHFADSVERLARAGAAAAVVASNTPHVAFDAIRRLSPIPLLSIVETAADAAEARGLRRLGLFGTRFTMDGRFYPDVFGPRGLALVVPSPGERAVVHDVYVNELLENVLREESRERLLAIARGMRARDGIEALVLGGTELPLLLSESSYGGLPVLDTARIHVEAFADLLWPESGAGG